MGAQLAPVEVTFRRRQKHELDKVTKLLSKEMPYLIERMLELTRSSNDKVAHDACKDLIDHHKTCAVEQEKDSITRAILSIKYGNGSKDLEELDSMPQIDFNNIQDV